MYFVYLQMPGEEPKQCYHWFKVQVQADRYAKLGAKACRATTIVMCNGREVNRFDYRPN